MPNKVRRLPATTKRVAVHTDAEINNRIRRQTAASIAYFAEHADEIDDRLKELEREWDIERLLETNASGLALAGLVLGVTLDRRFLILPALVTTFLLQHALQGWCPPVPVLRRLGVRTASEIDQERYALKYLRGDFGKEGAEGRSAKNRLEQVLAAVQAA